MLIAQQAYRCPCWLLSTGAKCRMSAHAKCRPHRCQNPATRSRSAVKCVACNVALQSGSAGLTCSVWRMQPVWIRKQSGRHRFESEDRGAGSDRPERSESAAGAGATPPTRPVTARPPARRSRSHGRAPERARRRARYQHQESACSFRRRQAQRANPVCQVQLKTFDTEGDPQKATAIAPQIVDDAFTIGLVGPAFSGETKATGSVFDQAGLVAATASATNVTLSEQGWKTFFRSLPTTVSRVGRQLPEEHHR